MEPMTLGSAPSSPSSPGTNPNFLPNFLMGDISQANSPNINNTSPGRNRTTPGALRKFGHISSTPDHRNPSFQPKIFDQSIINDSMSNKQQFTPQKPGPPSQGLFDTLDHKKRISSPLYNATIYGDSNSFNKNYSTNDDYFGSKNFSVNDTMNTTNFNRTDRVDTQWVTVFGFPPSALSLVLAQLSNCGAIIEKKMPPQGNWIHIKFEHLSDVARALALNGRCLNNSTMIGVSLHYNKENKENEISFTPIRARSLRQSFISPINLNESNSVLPPQNVPQKSTGLVSKAFEYVFGW